MRTPISSRKCVLALALLLVSPTIGNAQELFHSGGTGKCEGCHAFGEDPTQASPGQPGSLNTVIGKNSYLRGSDASSTCLRCHEAPAGSGTAKGYFVASASADIRGGQPPAQMTPGGDFGWLKKEYRWQEEGRFQKSLGAKHGHRIVAADNGYANSADGLSCISCHDPHGNYRRNMDGSITANGLPVKASGSYVDSPDPDGYKSVGTYRMLAGKGYQAKMQLSSVEFVADPPAAVAPVSYNRSEEMNDTRVAYGRGMSEWCQNCHPKIHTDGGDQHVSGNNATFSGQTAAVYDAYVKSGDLNGFAERSYNSLVPYEMGTDDYRILKSTANSDGSNLSGIGGSGVGNPNVMCLSCHRAHASGWDGMTRWNTTATFMVENGRYPGVDNRANPENAQGRTEAETRRSYYDRPASKFATFQRSLCNKCHAKD